MYTVKKEIDSQFAAMSKTVAYIEKRKDETAKYFKNVRKVLVLGSGSSYYLAKSLAAQIVGIAGISAAAIPAGDYLLHTKDYAAITHDAVVITISRSGSTSEIVYAVKCAEEEGARGVVSLCAAENADIAKTADINYEMPWIFDDAVCQTRTVSGLYIAGLMIAAVAAGNEDLVLCLKKVQDEAEVFRQKNEEELKAVAQLGWESAVVLADSWWAGLAEEGALAFKEICQRPSNHYHVLDVRHGPMVLINDKTLVVVMLQNNEKYQEGLVSDVLKKGAKTVSLGYGDKIDKGDRINLPFPENPVVGALFMIYTIQLLAYYKALAAGVNPDEPDGLDPWIKLSEV